MLPSFTLERKGTLQIYTIPLFTATGLVSHGFTTRHGGVSTGAYQSFNLGLHVGDEEHLVLENRRRACDALEMDFNKLVAAHQVHSDRIEVVTSQHVGQGANSLTSALPGVDGLVTNLPGVPLSSYYADCVPLFFLDPVNKVVGLAHAGWKGTVSKIGLKTVATMVRHFGSHPADILAGIGPSIGPCCYAVDKPVIEKLGYNHQQLLKPCGQGQWFLNLWAANQLVLLEAGIKKENIAVASICTACHSDILFSYRATGGRTGRMASLIMVK